jgi:uracil-DNA glycosylase
MEYSKFEKQFGSWAPDMKDFIESKECDNIYKYLKDRARKGATICPASDNTYRAFKECPKDNLKCVVLLMDPYPWVKNGIMVADGIAMSCGNTGELQPSLDMFYNGIEDDLYDGLNLNIEKNPDLTYLSNEGVLLLNTSLTTELNQVGAHKNLWDSMHKYLFDNVYPPEVPIVFMGKNAEELLIYADEDKNPLLICEHPAAAKWWKREWKHNKIFSKVNKLLNEQNKEEIQWTLQQSEIILKKT